MLKRCFYSCNSVCETFVSSNQLRNVFRGCRCRNITNTKQFCRFKDTQTRSFVSLEHQILEKSIDNVLIDLAIDIPTTVVPQPDFSDCNVLRQHDKLNLRPDLIYDVRDVDPLDIVKEDLSKLASNIKVLLGNDYPVLERVAKYFFDHDGGKKVRPALVLLVARATNAHRLAIGENDQKEQDNEKGAILSSSKLYASQMRLAEITEMIHTASLLHDDVIDGADIRRGCKSVNRVFGNKAAILAGDYLLARASVCLARLRNVSVVEILSTVIEHLVKGEILQMKTDLGTSDPFQYYLRKNYYKTGSLIANSLVACAVLGQNSAETQRTVFNFGENIGHAFQLIDDALDFEGSLALLGKPALNDLKSGIVTAPVLLAREEFPEISTMIERKVC